MSLFFALFLAKRTKDFINLDFARCCISQKEIERRNGPETSDLSHRTCFLAKEFHIFFSINMWHVFDLLCHRYNHFLRETPLATHPLSYIIIQSQQNILIHAVRNQVNFFKRSFNWLQALRKRYIKIFGKGGNRFLGKNFIIIIFESKIKVADLQWMQRSDLSVVCL